MSKVYELVGYYEDYEYGYGGWTGNSETVERVVATFDSEKAAHAYAKKAKLKKEKRGFHIANRVIFRDNSLLRECEGYEVRVRGEDEVAHNPEI